ncbi:MAG: YifB family Mg chelatase-like AAA ATPase [Clostridium sp.]|uniref:YifB family Mg chelatase-like AAA ATPase n=1 Tax=Clostridium sp. TaxID=1506 RepID=UPI003F2E4992
MAAIINGFGLRGINGYLVTIEVDTVYGKPMVSIVGMADISIKESRERIESSIKNSGFEFPKMKIVVNLSPSDIRKRGSHYDLGIAIGLLIQSKQINIEEVECYGFIGELSLNGELKPCIGVLPMVLEAKNRGINNLIVPLENLEEASSVKGVNIFAFNNLNEVIQFLQGVNPYKKVELAKNRIIKNEFTVDFSEVRGQDSTLEFIVAAAAGRHNILLAGEPGCGKSMIAKRIPTILPEMTEDEALETTKIHSVAGLLKNRGELVQKRPFRAPHHNASMNSLIGGGIFAMPGEISLAHNGVLFLDEIAEFSKQSLEGLRAPLEDGKVMISRVRSTGEFPANFMLVGAMNPCPCGYSGGSKCKCKDSDIIRYRGRLSGPIMDRIDIQRFLNPVKIEDLRGEVKGVESKVLKERVMKAREIQEKRFKEFNGINDNSKMPSDLIRRFCGLGDEEFELIKMAYKKFNFSARSYDKFLKIARTFADLDGCEKIKKIHLMKALMCREIEKDTSKLMLV